jgi:hypothetical protein
VADEAIGLAHSALRKLGLARSAVDVVLSGGIFRTTDGRFHARVRDGVLAFAPRANIVPFAGPPVLGAALLGLDRLTGVDARAERRLRAALDHGAIRRADERGGRG